jgi:hypothetical protein
MKTYTYEVTDVEKTIKELSVKAAESGIDVTGDKNSGEITGMGIKGAYSANGNNISFTIIDKPFFISEDKLESVLNDLVGGRMVD